MQVNTNKTTGFTYVIVRVRVRVRPLRTRTVVGAAVWFKARFIAACPEVYTFT